MKRLGLCLALFMMPVWVVLGAGDVCSQVPFNDPNTAHPYEADPNTYWCFDCHYFELLPASDKWVKTEIQVLPFHTALYPGTVSVYYPLGGDLVTDTCPTNCGPCQACHTQTAAGTPPVAVWRNDGTGTEHMDGNKNCLGCHPHWDDRYMFFPAGGGTGPSHELHLSDPKGPTKWDETLERYINISCDDCHAGNAPLLADGQDLAGTTVCDDCHSEGGNFKGVTDSVIGAKPNWVSPEGNSKIYNTHGTSLKSGKEDWCAGCHDDGTSEIPVGEGVYAPNVMGDNENYGYKVTGHGGTGYDCEDCHDLTIPHTDGEQRTYQASEENYKLGYRLNTGMIVPRETESEGDGAFALCTESCHDYEKLTRYFIPMAGYLTTSSFRGTYLPPTSQGGILHWNHLDPNQYQVCGDSDFDGQVDSSSTCILCHNAHGSSTGRMVRDGKLIGKEPGFDFKWYEESADPLTPGAETTKFNKSRWGSLKCGDQSDDPPTENPICFGCHLSGRIYYFREPTITVERVWTSDYSGEETRVLYPDGPVRYNVDFTIAGPPSSMYVKTKNARATNTIGPDWETKFRLTDTLGPDRYTWAADSGNPTKWNLTIPSIAQEGTNAAKVIIPMQIYNKKGGKKFDNSKGQTVFDIVPAP